jgi:hypothetical protein
MTSGQSTEQLVHHMVRQCWHGGPPHKEVAGQAWYDMTHHLALTACGHHHHLDCLCFERDPTWQELVADLLDLRVLMQACRPVLDDTRSSNVLASMAVEEWVGGDLTACRRYCVLAAMLQGLHDQGAKDFFRWLRNPGGAPQRVKTSHELLLRSSSSHGNLLNSIQQLVGGKCRCLSMARDEGVGLQCLASVDVLSGSSVYWTVKTDAERLFKARNLTAAEAGYRAALEMLKGANAALMSNSSDANYMQNLRAVAQEMSKLESNRSLILRTLGSAEAALDAANNAVANNPEWPKAHARRAQALVALQRRPHAAASYWKAAEFAQRARDEGDSSAPDPLPFERAARKQEQLADEHTVAMERAKQEAAATQLDEDAKFDALCEQLLELGLVSEAALDELTDGLERGEQTVAGLTAVWAPKVAQAQLMMNTGSFSVLGAVADIVLEALPPRSLSAIESTCHAFRAFGGAQAAERTRRHVWTARLVARCPSLAAEITRYHADVEIPAAASLQRLVRAASTTLTFHEHGPLFQMGEDLPLGLAEAFWSEYVAWWSEQDRSRQEQQLEPLPIYPRPLFYKEVLCHAERFHHDSLGRCWAVEAVLSAMCEHLGEASERYRDIFEEEEGLHSLFQWQRLAEANRNELHGVSCLFSHGLVTDTMRLLRDSGRASGFQAEIIDICCTLLHNLLAALGQIIQESPLPRLLLEPLQELHRLWSTVVPKTLPGGNDAKIGLYQRQPLRSEAIADYFAANPTVLRRWRTALLELGPWLESATRWGHVLPLRVHSILNGNFAAMPPGAGYLTFAGFLVQSALERGGAHQLLATLTSSEGSLAAFFAGWYEQVSLFNTVLPRVQTWSRRKMAEHRRSMEGFHAPPMEGLDGGW